MLIPSFSKDACRPGICCWTNLSLGSFAVAEPILEELDELLLLELLGEEKLEPLPDEDELLLLELLDDELEELLDDELLGVLPVCDAG